MISEFHRYTYPLIIFMVRGVVKFNGLRDTTRIIIFAQDIDLVYVSKRLSHVTIQIA